MTRQRKTLADLRADLTADPPWDSDEYRALVAAGLRAPNQRHFTILCPYAWELFRPPPTMLPPFDASYAARIANGHTVRDNYGMWVGLDAGDPGVISQVGSGLGAEFPPIAHFTLDELEADVSGPTAREIDDVLIEHDVTSETPNFTTVGEVLAWARVEIAKLSGMASETIKLDLKIEA